MALRYLGPRFDIHTGGIDNVFPHHEDEIAQSAPIVGDAPARVWVHGEHLLMAGLKMAKSAGNFVRVTELEQAGTAPLAFRYLVLTSRYGHKLNFSDESLAGAAAALASLRSRLAALGPPPADGPWMAPPVIRAGQAPDRPEGVAPGVAGHGQSAEPDAAAPGPLPDRAHHPAPPLSPPGRDAHERFVAALDADLDLPAALAVVREIARSAFAVDERRWLLLDADAVLGLDLDRVWADGSSAPAVATDEVPTAARELVAQRQAARAARDFAHADALREEIAALGYEAIDEPDGTRLRPLSETRRGD
jgi:cysteinyl-tRNA synthetase